MALTVGDVLTIITTNLRYRKPIAVRHGKPTVKID